MPQSVPNLVGMFSKRDGFVGPAPIHKDTQSAKPGSCSPFLLRKNASSPSCPGLLERFVQEALCQFSLHALAQSFSRFSAGPTSDLFLQVLPSEIPALFLAHFSLVMFSSCCFSAFCQQERFSMKALTIYCSILFTVFLAMIQGALLYRLWPQLLFLDLPLC